MPGCSPRQAGQQSPPRRKRRGCPACSGLGISYKAWGKADVRSSLIQHRNPFEHIDELLGAIIGRYVLIGFGALIGIEKNVFYAESLCAINIPEHIVPYPDH